jgi:hypothetical protein
VERSHQTLEKWRAAQPRATSIAQLQAQLEAFVEIYNRHIDPDHNYWRNQNKNPGDGRGNP